MVKVIKAGKMKRLLSIMMVLVLCCGLLPMTALADSQSIIKVTVAVYDYTAVGAGLTGASSDGVVMATREVEVDLGSKGGNGY